MTRQKRPTFVDEVTIRAVAEYAAGWTGYQRESVSETAVRRALRAELIRGATLDVLRERAAAGDPELVRVVSAALAVGETYFFRNPDQLEAIADHASRLVASGHRVIRAWSAGCATGEEAYSLAATLLAVVGTDADAPAIEVVGTDIHERALDVARRGAYRGSSIRPSGPLRHPVLAGPDLGGDFHVIERVRTHVAFVQHDLRNPPPGRFQLIVCRNVLLYFSRPIARTICDHLASALAPDGLLALGTIDVDAADVVGLVRFGDPELQLYRPPAAPRADPIGPGVTTIVPRRARTDPHDAVIAAHRDALEHIECGRPRDAGRALRDLNHRHPAYLPGLLERALHDARQGDRAAALERMRAILDLANELPADQIVPGIESLPASFYATSAREFLSRHEKGAR
jgi:chemotaxis protein methyltransferase CheR